MNREKRTLYAAFDESALKTLLEQNHNQLQRSLEANFGLKPGAVHYYSLKKAVHGIQEAEKKPLPEIIQLLCEIPMREDIVRLIVPHITVYETYFFRHPEHFAWMRDSFLPELEIRKRAEGRLTIACWSAGCSTGEEAYSLAITLFDYFKGKEGWELKVVATDINHESLEIARHGCYGDWSFRDLPRETKERFFYECHDALELVPGLPRLTRYHIDSRIQQMVTFAELNLNAPQWNIPELSTRTFDLIVCRNVLIYLHQSAAKALIARFAEYLEPNGALIVGPSEPWFLNDSPFAAQPIRNGTIFIKKENSGQSMPSTTQPAARRLENPKSIKSLAGSLHHQITKPAESLAPQKTAPAESLAPPQPASKTSFAIPLHEAPLHAAAEREEVIANARHLADSGEASRAIELLSELIQKETTDPELYYLRGLAYIHTRDFSSAESDLKKSLFLEPDNVVAYIALASIAKERGNESEMKKHYSNALHFLSKIEETAVVPGSNGIPAKAMRDMISSLMAK